MQPIVQEGLGIKGDKNPDKGLCRVQVMEEGVPGARVIVADCPSARYLPSLLRCKEFGQLTQAAGAAGLTCVVHLTPVKVSLTQHCRPRTAASDSPSRLPPNAVSDSVRQWMSFNGLLIFRHRWSGFQSTWIGYPLLARLPSISLWRLPSWQAQLPSWNHLLSCR